MGNLEAHELQFALFFLPLAVMGIAIASAVAMFEGHIKRLLAFSSVAQIGYIILGASFMTYEGLTASTIHMFNHALAKGALLLAVAGLATRFDDLRLDQLGGAAARMPLTAAALVVAGFSLVGVPATAGFISKWLLIVAALEQGVVGIGLVVLILVSSLMALVYVWRIIETLYFKPVQQGDTARREAPRAPRS